MQFNKMQFTEEQIQTMMKQTNGNRSLAIQYLKEMAEFNNHLG